MNENSYMEKRLDGLRKKLKEKGFDAALVTKRENYFYLSGFTGTLAHLIISQDEALLVTDFRYDAQASLQAPLYKIIRSQGEMPVTINELLKTRGIEKLGFEETDLTFDRYRKYKEKIEVGEFVPLEGIIENLRRVKSREEIDEIKKAVKIADDAFSYILDYLKPGITETEISAEIEYFMKKQGASGASFETIVASGERSALPHGVASTKELQSGEAVVLDYGAIYNGYCSDITRTVFLGKPDDKLHKIYEIVLHAQIKSLESIHSGLYGKEIDNIARDIIAGAGYGDCFGHGLGHGVGLEIHEEPRFSPSGDIQTENGMVVTVEPGIYINGLGGVRIEDMIVIDGDKAAVLTKASKEIIIL